MTDPTGPQPSGPLRGLRVFDLTRVLAGPTCAQMLGDLGADVVKIERPGAGDDPRGFAPPFMPGTKESAYFTGVNRNKQSVTLDIAQKVGQEIALKLISECDIFVENFKVGALGKYGLGYEQLHAKFPRLIYCSITGFGQTGPYAPRPGYDRLIQGMGGEMSLHGAPDGLPRRVGVRGGARGAGRQARAHGRPLAWRPAVVGAGRFQHHCLVYNAERAPVTVDQLRGKRVGIRAHAQTTVTWVRGVLSNDYGVVLPDVQWVTFEDGHLAEVPDPPGFIRAPAGSSAVEMLLAGELDAAIIGTDLPDDPRLQPVLPNPHIAARAWSRRLQMLPINHMMVIDLDLCREHPEVVRELYALLLQSKAMASANGPKELDLTPFGVEPNRRALEVLIRYSFEQGLIPRVSTVDEWFEDVLPLLEPA